MTGRRRRWLLLELLELLSRLRAKVAEDEGLRSEGCVRSRTLTASAYIDLPEDNAR